MNCQRASKLSRPRDLVRLLRLQNGPFWGIQPRSKGSIDGVHARTRRRDNTAYQIGINATKASLAAILQCNRGHPLASHRFLGRSAVRAAQSDWACVGFLTTEVEW